MHIPGIQSLVKPVLCLSGLQPASTERVEAVEGGDTSIKQHFLNIQ